MKKTQISAPEWANVGNDCVWLASYDVKAAENVRMIRIESRSAIEIVAAKMLYHNSILGSHTMYFVSSPNYGIAIPSICSLTETNWISERLIGAGMPVVDAVTTAQVLREVGDF